MSKEIIVTESSKKFLTEMAAKAAELKKEGKMVEYKELIASIGEVTMPILNKLIDCESAAQKLDEETKEYYAQAVYNVYERDFYKYNNVEFKKQGQEEIENELSTFMKGRIGECSRFAIAKKFNIKQNEARNLLRIRTARSELSKEKSIREDRVSLNDIYERMGREVKMATIVSLVNIEKGCKSLEELRESGECVEIYIEKGFDIDEDKLEPEIERKLDKIFDKYSKLDILIFMKKYGFFDEDINKMETKEFVKLPIFVELFEQDNTCREKIIL